MVNSISSGTGGRDRGAQPRAAAAPPAQPPRAPGADHVVHARFTSPEGRPVANARYEVLRPDGTLLVGGTTDWQGNARQEVTEPATYTVRLVEFPAGAAPAEE